MVNFFPPPTTFAHSPSFFPVRAIVEEKGPERTMNFQNVDGRNCGKMLSYRIEIRADSTPVRNGVTLNRKSRFSEPILFLSNTTRPDSIDRCDSVNEQQKMERRQVFRAKQLSSLAISGLKWIPVAGSGWWWSRTGFFGNDYDIGGQKSWRSEHKTWPVCWFVSSIIWSSHLPAFLGPALWKEMMMMASDIVGILPNWPQRGVCSWLILCRIPVYSAHGLQKNGRNPRHNNNKTRKNQRNIGPTKEVISANITCRQ